MKYIILILILLIASINLDSEETKMLRKGLPMGVPIKSGIVTTTTLNGSGFYIISGYNMTEYPCKVNINNLFVGNADPFSSKSMLFNRPSAGTQVTVKPEIIDPNDPYANSYHLMQQIGQVSKINTFQMTAALPGTFDTTAFNDYFFVFNVNQPCVVQITINETRTNGMIINTTYNANVTSGMVLNYFIDEGSTLHYVVSSVSGSIATVDVYTFQ